MTGAATPTTAPSRGERLVVTSSAGSTVVYEPWNGTDLPSVPSAVPVDRICSAVTQRLGQRPGRTVRAGGSIDRNAFGIAELQ